MQRGEWLRVILNALGYPQVVTAPFSSPPLPRPWPPRAPRCREASWRRRRPAAHHRLRRLRRTGRCPTRRRGTPRRPTPPAPAPPRHRPAYPLRSARPGLLPARSCSARPVPSPLPRQCLRRQCLLPVPPRRGRWSSRSAPGRSRCSRCCRTRGPTRTRAPRRPARCPGRRKSRARGKGKR